MKIGILISLLSALLFATCNVNNSYAHIDNLPGTYVRYSEHEFGKEYDTLVISTLDKGRFQVLRKWKYERVLDGVAQEPEYKQVVTTAVLDGKIRRIVDSDTRNFIDLDTEKGRLLDGDTEYMKLK